MPHDYYIGRGGRPGPRGKKKDGVCRPDVEEKDSDRERMSRKARRLRGDL